jgi:hypothetical protein
MRTGTPVGSNRSAVRIRYRERRPWYIDPVPVLTCMMAIGAISAGPAFTTTATMAARSDHAGHGHRSGRSGIATDRPVAQEPRSIFEIFRHSPERFTPYGVTKAMNDATAAHYDKLFRRQDCRTSTACFFRFRPIWRGGGSLRLSSEIAWPVILGIEASFRKERRSGADPRSGYGRGFCSGGSEQRTP